jgi:hypothetical protein
MLKKTHVQTYPRRGPGNDSYTMVIYFGISLLIHLIFIGAVIWLPDMAPKRRLLPGAINVNLVSLPGPRTARPSSGSAAKKAPVAKPVEVRKKKAPVMTVPPPKPPPVPAKAQKKISLAPARKSRKIKKSLKKKTFDRQKMIHTATLKCLIPETDSNTTPQNCIHYCCLHAKIDVTGFNKITGSLRQVCISPNPALHLKIST